MILVSKSIYLSRDIQCCIYISLYITHSHKHVQFLPKKSKIGSKKTRDMIFVHKSLSTRSMEFNDASRKILKSLNVLHDITIFIEITLLKSIKRGYYQVRCTIEFPGGGPFRRRRFGSADSALDNSASCRFGAGHFGAVS